MDETGVKLNLLVEEEEEPLQGRIEGTYMKDISIQPKKSKASDTHTHAPPHTHAHQPNLSYKSLTEY